MRKIRVLEARRLLPKLIHFVFGMAPQEGPGEFALHHYICVKSARALHPGHELVLWHGHAPTQNPYWEAASKLCTPVKIDPPTQIFGNPLHIHAHRTDLVRLQALDEFGGAYVDLDSILIRAFDDLFVRGALMGLEVDEPVGKVHGLCNAVILAMPRSSFLRRWLDSFEHFFSAGHDAGYAFFAVKLPHILAKQRSDDIEIVGHRHFFPFWCDEYGLSQIFEKDSALPAETRSLHLWESQAKLRGHLRAITSHAIFNVPTLYNRLASNYVTASELQALADQIP